MKVLQSFEKFRSHEETLAELDRILEEVRHVNLEDLRTRRDPDGLEYYENLFDICENL